MLISEIRDEIIADVGGDTTDTGLQTTVLGCIKDGLGRLPAYLRARALVTVGTLTLSAGSGSVSISTLTGFKKERLVWYVSSGQRVEVYYKKRDVFNTFKNTTVGNPEYYSIYETTLEVNRNADVDYTLYVDYFKHVRAVAASDTFAGADEHITALKDLAKFIYYTDYQEDSQRGLIHLNAAKDILGELDADYAEQEQGGYVEEA